VLLAAGAWIPDLARLVGINLPLYPKLQQVLVTEPGPMLFPEIVTHISGRLTLKQQSDTGKVLVGGGWRGTGPAEPGKHRIDRANMVSNVQLALATIPGMASLRLMRGWSGIEGRSPDRLPVMGPVGDPPGLHVLGCSAGGFTLSPILGRIMAEIIVDEKVALSYAEFGVKRLTANR
jgi:sarcosine oxidase, subunit beta